MASALPHRPPVDHTPSERATVVVDPDESAAVLQALTSATAQEILGTLRDAPRTPSDLADVVDTSLQNVHYHLDRLREAGLVEAVETWYSAKGTEMTVYALTTEELVVQFGEPTDQSPTNDGRDWR